MRDVVGLYLNPPDKAVVLSVNDRNASTLRARVVRQSHENELARGGRLAAALPRRRAGLVSFLISSISLHWGRSQATHRR